MYCELLPILDKDIVVLTANQRLCRHLYQQFAQYQITQQKKNTVEHADNFATQYLAKKFLATAS